MHPKKATAMDAIMDVPILVVEPAVGVAKTLVTRLAAVVVAEVANGLAVRLVAGHVQVQVGK